MSPNRSEYQPLAQSAEDEEADVSEGLAPPTRGLRRAQRPVHIDLSKLDNAFKRYVICAFASPLPITSCATVMQVDRVHRTEGQAQEEGPGQFQEGDMA